MLRTETYVAGLILLLTLFVVGSGVLTWRSYQDVKAAQLRNARIEVLTGEIQYLDEVLTMSARMGAATNNPEWEQRYLSFEPKLDAVIQEAEGLLPAAFASESAQVTNEANIALVNMEHQAFELSRNGRASEALSLLSSAEYRKQKSIYGQGNEQIRAFLLAAGQSTLAESERQWLMSIFPGAAATLAALSLAVVLNVNLLRRRAAQAALSELNEVLESRVSERTEQLVVQQETLRQSEARFRSLIQNSSSVVTVVDADGRIRYQSATVETLLGYGQNELITTAFIDLVNPEDHNLVANLMAQVISQPAATHSVDCRLRMKSGAWVLSEVIAQNLMDDRNVQGVVVTASDIGQRKALEEQLTHQALHDPLTGLPNRLLFKERLEHAIEQRSEPNVYDAVLFLDLDDFKTVNDSLGHFAGDEFLIKVAERLRGNARSGDTVSRFGGDEFALLLADISKKDARYLANRILESMKEPFWIEDHAVNGSLSIGLVFADGDKPDATDLLRDADTAMYVAKARGKGRVEVFSPAMHEIAVGRLGIEAEVRVGIKEQQFEVYYQPVLSCASQAVVGFEALVRWNHPQRGLLLPSAFMGIAEETGLILPLGEQVLMQACKQAVLWQRRYPANPPMSVAVNLSARELTQPSLLDRISKALKDSGLAPESLILEITETVVLPKSHRIVEKLEALRSLGVRLAIDDFGTGYATLAYLHDFPVDIVKIDKSFVDGISDEPAGAFSNAIIALARDLSLSTIAEGVERSGQLERLNDIGCDLWQGFLFSEALSQVDMERLLANPTEGSTTKNAA